ASCDELDRLSLFGAPNKPAADRPLHLEAVSEADDLGEIGRYFTVRQPFDGNLNAPVGVGRRSQGIGPDSRVSILSRQAHIHVLAGQVTRPVRNFEGNSPGGRSFVVESNDSSHAPHYLSPEYRCSRQGSPYM